MRMEGRNEEDVSGMEKEGGEGRGGRRRIGGRGSWRRNEDFGEEMRRSRWSGRRSSRYGREAE
jgi:hypothetical protein